MWLRTSCEMTFDIIVPTPFILMLRLRSGAQQWVASEEYRLTPTVPVFEFTDNYGNLCQRLIAPPGAFSVYTSADVMTSEQVDQSPGAPFVEVENLPDAVLSYLLPSRFCESDRFGEMATSIVDGQQLGYDQVKTIVSWLRTNIRYEPGSSEIPTDWGVKTRVVCTELSNVTSPRGQTGGWVDK
jgi:transglutaminase-like putative cysteine protease